MQNKKQQARFWFITLNNPLSDWRDECDKIKCDWFLGQLEQGQQGTKHVQGVCYFQKRQTFGKLKKINDRIHWEQCRSEAANDYVTKEDTRLDGPYEYGIKPVNGKKYTTIQMLEMPVKQAVEENIIHWSQVSNLVKNQAAYKLQTMEKYVANDVRGVWIHGEPGTGKSHTAREMFKDLGPYYYKQQNKWFDGYQGEKVILLDDFDSKILGHHIKIWADKWDCTGEIKGGSVPLVHEKFIITSNYTPDQIWNDMIPEEKTLIEAINRRFQFIYKSDKF